MSCWKVLRLSLWSCCFGSIRWGRDCFGLSSGRKVMCSKDKVDRDDTGRVGFF